MGCCALGLARMGVLRWFEQHHIPVDFPAGTITGGLVGGLYATGNSPDKIERMVRKIDWPLVIGGETPYGDLSFRRKENARAVPTIFNMGFKRGVSLPSGLNAGHQIGLVIDHETLAYSPIRSFDNLPIPFRCVSTELISVVSANSCLHPSPLSRKRPDRRSRSSRRTRCRIRFRGSPLPRL